MASDMAHQNRLITTVHETLPCSEAPTTQGYNRSLNGAGSWLSHEDIGMLLYQTLSWSMSKINVTVSYFVK